MEHDNRDHPICCCLFSPCTAKGTSGNAAEPLFKEQGHVCVTLPTVEVGVTIWQRRRGQEPSAACPGCCN